MTTHEHAHRSRAPVAEAHPSCKVSTLNISAPSIFLGKNRCDIGQSQSTRTASKISQSLVPRHQLCSCAAGLPATPSIDCTGDPLPSAVLEAGHGGTEDGQRRSLTLLDGAGHLQAHRRHRSGGPALPAAHERVRHDRRGSSPSLGAEPHAGAAATQRSVRAGDEDIGLLAASPATSAAPLIRTPQCRGDPTVCCMVATIRHDTLRVSRPDEPPLQT
eukprot:COSAG01_NODE_2076_length_8486_cov_41.323000_6_plen_217_part_00